MVLWGVPGYAAGSSPSLSPLSPVCIPCPPGATSLLLAPALRGVDRDGGGAAPPPKKCSGTTAPTWEDRKGINEFVQDHTFCNFSNTIEARTVECLTSHLLGSLSFPGNSRCCSGAHEKVPETGTFLGKRGRFIGSEKGT